MKIILIFLLSLLLLVSLVSCTSAGGIGVVTFDPLLLFMSLIQPGNFMMGDTKALSPEVSPLRPVHSVAFTYSFYIKKGEVYEQGFS